MEDTHLHNLPIFHRALRMTTLALAFGRVERATFHEDGKRPETDTDHTVGLAWTACELAARRNDLIVAGEVEGVVLNVDRVATYCLVHDAVEVLTLDEQTLTLDAAGREAKAAREKAALAALRTMLGPGSWLIRHIEEYEAQATHEARYVRVLDKVMPKLTHILNGCVAAKALTDFAGFLEAHRDQYRRLREDYPEPELSWVLDLLLQSMIRSEGVWRRADELEGAAAAPGGHQP